VSTHLLPRVTSPAIGTTDASSAVALRSNTGIRSEDRLVFHGGSNRHRGFQPGPLLIHAEEQLDHPHPHPALSASAHRDGGDSDAESPERKRMRLDDEYEIALAVLEVPRNYKEAMGCVDAVKWKDAIRSEIKSHVTNHTWDLVSRPHGVKVIGHKWVFAHKFGEMGEIVRYKARLVALGFLQTHGVDYTDTYSPVASTNTIRVFLSMCCHHKLFIRQFDIETAFLNGDLEETVYMSVPEGIAVADGICVSCAEVYTVSSKQPMSGSRRFDPSFPRWGSRSVVRTHVCSSAMLVRNRRCSLCSMSTTS
jgi:hypothetical protein